MAATAVNEQYLQGNTCFGCGPANPEGLQIRIYRQEPHTDRLVGVYRPRPTAGGFPQIVHGGLQFTALDCMAGWVVLLLRNNLAQGPQIPVTKSAGMRFHRPATLGTELSLTARVSREAQGPKAPLSIHTEILDPAGVLLSEADFEYVLLSEDRFKKAVGLGELPEGYRHHFATLMRPRG